MAYLTAQSFTIAYLKHRESVEHLISVVKVLKKVLLKAHTTCCVVSTICHWSGWCHHL